uniref:Dihydroflavonol-4-reductase n=2 Tax=Anthurium amnicola TaxID=1678845 RepID=A0A1D1XR99_9ARAE
MCTAIAGCEGVFHVASPVVMGKLQNPEVEVITPAVTGTLNVLKASDEAKIKRVVVVSSIAAIVLNANWPQDRPMDEDCWSERELCKITENWYCLAKTMAEREALDFGERTGLKIVTISPSLAIGPCLQSKLNYSSSFLLNLFKEGEEPMERRVWYLVDVRDVIEAMLLIYLNPAATGRYICTTQAIRISDLVEKLKHMYPNYSYTKNFIEIDQEQELSSEKMQRLGWRPRRFEDSLVDAVDYFKEVGFLSKD